VLLAAVPLVSLVLLLALASLAIKQTEIGAAANDRLADLLTRSEGLVESLSTANRSVAVYTKTRRASDLAPLDANASSLKTAEQQFLRATAGDAALQSRAQAYEKSVAAGMTVVQRYAAALRANDLKTTRAIAASPATRQLGLDLQRNQIRFNQGAEIYALRTIAARRGTLRLIEALLVIGSIVGIALTVVVLLLYGRRIVERLEQLGDNARRLAEGAPALPVSGNDEIAELDALYRVMADRIAASSRAHRDTLAELARERGAADLLQKALLPEIPRLDGVRIDTAYLTPAEGAQIGGDWYDVFPLSERFVGLSVGDVTGHGSRAAATMGFLRQSIRIVARLDGHHPATVLERVNRVVCEEGAGLATAFFAIFDRVTGVLRYALAGHGAPLVVTPLGDIAQVEGDGLLLGIDPAVRYTTFERTLAPGEGLVVYTDGIVEVERDYLKGMRDLEWVVASEFLDRSDNIAEGIQRRAFAQRPPRDDSAVLVLVLTELMPASADDRTEWHFDARDEDVARRVKRELLAALAALGPLRPEPMVAEMVFGELLSNVVRHTPGPACVSFAVEDGHVVFSVADRGPMFRVGGAGVNTDAVPDDAESGRGLFMIAALCERLGIEPRPDGKCATVVLPLAEDDAWTQRAPERVAG
jgi:anti-sigma regulatory factor (Ser/Thr protein kinase)